MQRWKKLYAQCRASMSCPTTLWCTPRHCSQWRKWHEESRVTRHNPVPHEFQRRNTENVVPHDMFRERCRMARLYQLPRFKSPNPRILSSFFRSPRHKRNTHEQTKNSQRQHAIPFNRPPPLSVQASHTFQQTQPLQGTPSQYHFI